MSKSAYDIAVDARTRALGRLGLKALADADREIDAIYREVAAVRALIDLSADARTARERDFIEKHFHAFSSGQVDLRNVIHELRMVFDPALTPEDAANARPWVLNLPNGRVCEVRFNDTLGDIYRKVRDAYDGLADKVARDHAARAHVEAWRKVLLQCAAVGASDGPGYDLTETEQNIVTALGNDTLRAKEIATRAGYTYDAVRRHLSELVKRGHLVKVRGGYANVSPM